MPARRVIFTLKTYEENGSTVLESNFVRLTNDFVCITNDLFVITKELLGRHCSYERVCNHKQIVRNTNKIVRIANTIAL